MSLDYIGATLTEIAFSAITANKGSCILYLTHPQTQRLNIFKTKKEDNQQVIKAKEGDVFDLWVLKHSTPLLIEDIKKDFRFDLEKLQEEYLRPISSLISAPLISEDKFLGILRLDNQEAQFYTQDDLRFLLTICDLGAVALENSGFFEETQELAIRDGLTGLFTKGYFLERLKEECKRSLRHKQAPFSLLMLDIDYFKAYNDKFGHSAGDIVLKTLSSNISEFFKGKDALISRFGGEEFCLIVSNTAKKDALNLAERLRKSIAEAKMILRRQETNVTVSIGIAAFPEGAADENELIHKADQAMYAAKQKGRNRVCSA